MPPHPTSQRCILVVPSHLHVDCPSGLFPSGLPTKPCMLLSCPICATCPTYLILLDLIMLTVFGGDLLQNIWKLINRWLVYRPTSVICGSPKRNEIITTSKTNNSCFLINLGNPSWIEVTTTSTMANYGKKKNNITLCIRNHAKLLSWHVF